jgi:hypothetical protein
VSLREVPWRYRDPFEGSDEIGFPLGVRPWLRLHSVSYRGFSDLWATLRGWRSNALRSPAEGPDGAAGPPWESGVFATDGADPRWEKAWLVTDGLLGLAKAAARERGAELRVVLVPHYATVQPDLTPAQVEPQRFDLARAHVRLTAMARTRDIPLLDLTPAFVEFRRRDPQHRALFFARDKHFTALGHCFTAVLVARWLGGATAAEPVQCA